jgi:hypothetical protein
MEEAMPAASRLLAILSVLLSTPVIALQKPVITTNRHVDYRDRIFSADELWNAASVVVDVTITSSQPLDVKTAKSVAEFTVYDALVFEVYKPSSQVKSAGSTIRVRRTGGDRDRGQHIERTVEDGFPPFQVGEQYTLFLREHVANGDIFYSALVGPDGAFKVNGNLLETHGKRELARDIAAKHAIGAKQWLREKKMAEEKRRAQ